MRQQDTELLQQDDHMNGMQHTVMTITAITQPYDSIVRVYGKIDTKQIAQWCLPNLAIRIDVEQQHNGRPLSRIYTVRHFDPQSQQIEVDIVLHGGQSPAMRWLNTLSVGSIVSLTGPRIHVNPHWESQKTCIILADDTALPAVYAMLKQWPKHVRAEIFVATAEVTLIQEFPILQDVNYHVLLQENSVQSELLIALTQFKASEEITLWAACERQQARQIREYALKQLQLARTDVRVFGYWKAGMSSSVIDEARVKHYTELVAQGQGLEAFDDLDVQI
ncbi:siderophore-interacting protein [Acinetobacter rudis]|uniref:Siderophore-interacting protein n=1 Tax=Acinetobacter rudis TaxID=632955 RepID=A0AAW8J9F0_9GAMM|nr:siderophore-interacting protein [Acinetobacter rudis]MDQ8935331.1 siderophore-interacting protein [Acinetobacter rudis]MDQ8952359.1 siderophore-interacting protein [Acinetobacter rudis]MDQ9017594.1 siderophore-interacting protein [Acinetobacter rudis]